MTYEEINTKEDALAWIEQEAGKHGLVSEVKSQFEGYQKQHPEKAHVPEIIRDDAWCALYDWDC